MTQKLLTVKEVSEILDLKPARIYELTREKKIPFVQIGERQYRYSETALLNWIERGGNQQREVNQNENEPCRSSLHLPDLVRSRQRGGCCLGVPLQGQRLPRAASSRR